MNTKEYIESGLLEAYVLGALPPDEHARVAADVAAHPKLAAEVEAIEEALLSSAQANAVTPPAHMQQQIWIDIDPEVARTKQPSKEINLPPHAPVAHPSYSWARAAVWVLLLASAVTNIYLLSEKNKYEEQQLALQQRTDSMAQQQQNMQQVIANMQQERDMLADPDMQTVVMKSMKGNKEMAGMIYWNKEEGTVYLALHNMPVPEAGKQYQLWVLQDGKPLDMGVIPNEMVGTNDMQKIVKNVTNGQAFAISLEKVGGSPTPTMEEIYVMGQAS